MPTIRNLTVHEVKHDVRPRDLKYWWRAIYVADELTDEDWDVVEDYIVSLGREEWDMDDLNDMLSDGHFIAKVLGYKNWTDLYVSRHGDS